MSKENIKLHIPRWKELPNVDLYLDQVVTLVNETLSSFLSLNRGVFLHPISIHVILKKKDQMENIDLKKLSADQLCDLFNDETSHVDHWDIIHEFIDRKISTVNIQRASGSMRGRSMRIWYNEERNCIEVRGRAFFEGTDLLQW